MKSFAIFLFALIVSSYVAYCQDYTLSGYIQDEETGEKFIGASIYDKSSLAGTSSNAYGFFSLTLQGGSYDIVFSYVGFQAKEMKIDLSKIQQLNIGLKARIELEEVEIKGQRLGAICGINADEHDKFIS